VNIVDCAILQKRIAPILTRWWMAGEASSFTFDYHLQLCHACQTVINVYPSDFAPNRIASSLCALMFDQENFVDLTLICCFKEGHMNEHLDWLQSCDDMSGAQAFQSHNVAIWCFLMSQDLESLSGVMRECAKAATRATSGRPNEWQ